MEIEKIIFDDSAGTVENRNNVEVCVFKTETGKEVLFSRDKNDNIVKCFEGQLSSADFVKARGIAGQRLVKKFLVKESQFTRKVVPTPAAPVKPKPSPQGAKPEWLRSHLAVTHARKISPHTDDD